MGSSATAVDHTLRVRSLIRVGSTDRRHRCRLRAFTTKRALVLSRRRYMAMNRERGARRRRHGVAAGLLLVTAAAWTVLIAAGNDARYINPLPWKKDHVANVYGLGYTELGSDIGGTRSRVDVRTIDGASCLVGPTVSFDVDNRYAFDVDEPVRLTLTYAPAQTVATALAVLYDKNGGDGRGAVEVATQKGVTGLQHASVTLERARLAGMGARQTDFAVNGRGGAIALCDIQIARSGSTKTPAAFGQLRLSITDAQT